MPFGAHPRTTPDPLTTKTHRVSPPIPSKILDNSRENEHHEKLNHTSFSSSCAHVSMNCRIFFLPQQAASEELKSEEKHSRTQSSEAFYFYDVADQISPTSLTCKTLWTRGSWPWRPGANMWHGPWLLPNQKGKAKGGGKRGGCLLRWFLREVLEGGY